MPLNGDLLEHLKNNLSIKPSIVFTNRKDCFTLNLDLKSFLSAEVVVEGDQFEGSMDMGVAVNHQGQQMYKIALASSEAKMRGFDFRSREVGIDLFLCSAFTSEREFHQACGRVGRNNDPSCRRFTTLPLSEMVKADKKSLMAIKSCIIN